MTNSVKFGDPRLPEKFWSHCALSETGCWLWTGSKKPAGYGYFCLGDKKIYAHRRAYEYLVGSIPDGLVIDHICRVKNCVNPEHLRVVTVRTNSLENSLGIGALHAKKTHCVNGHELSKENTYQTALSGSRRICKICKRITGKAAYHRKLAAKSA